MMYTPETVEKICTLDATGNYSIKDVCTQAGISRQTYYEWKKSYPEFADELKKAEQERLEAFKTMAHSGLVKLLMGYEYEEETIRYGRNGDVISRKVFRKSIMPNPTAVIFTLTNRSPEHWRHKQHVDTNVTVEQPLFPDMEKFTFEQLYWFKYGKKPEMDSYITDAVTTTNNPTE